MGVHPIMLSYSPPGALFNPGMFLTIPRKKMGILDCVISSCWFDAMKALSPPQQKIVKASSEITSTDIPDVAYLNWTLKFLSAITSFEEITNHAKGKRIPLFLDYDGTLSPIVDNPDRAFMCSAMRAAVRDVANCFPDCNNQREK